jgi:SAM-dependent methyltransferase
MSVGHFDYTERPKQFARDDFLRQVRRTINGEPVPESQLAMIDEQIKTLLNLEPSDRLIDAGCGNGAICHRIAPAVQRVHGFDVSEYLIEIGSEFFASDRLSFEVASVEDVVRRSDFGNFNKMILYGVSSYLTDDELSALIVWFFKNQGESLLLGNCRDREKAEIFFGHTPGSDELNDVNSQMGKWRELSWYMEIAREVGAAATPHKMPDSFYASAHYFDVVIKRL